jgi:hypothetical protein
MYFRSRYLILVLLIECIVLARGDNPEPAWKNEIDYPSETFQSWTSPPYVKFTIITKEDFDPNVCLKRFHVVMPKNFRVIRQY